MASTLDPKTLKDLHTAIKLLTGTGQEIANKSRDLMTFIYAAQEGFFKTHESLREALEGAKSGKFEVANLRKFLKELQVADDLIEDTLEKRKELDKLDTDRIRSTKNYYKLLDLINDIEEDRFNLSSRSISAFDELNNQLIDQHRLIKSMGISESSNVDILMKQIQKHEHLNKVFENEYIAIDEVKDQLSTVNDVIDNISSAKTITIGDVKFSTKDAIDHINKVSNRQIDLLKLEDQVRRKKLLEFIAFSSGKKMNIETGEIFDKNDNKILGDNLELFKTHLSGISANYEMLINSVGEHGELTENTITSLNTIVDRLAESQKLSEKETIDLRRMTYEIVKQNAVQKIQNDLALRRLSNSNQHLKILNLYAPALRRAQSLGNELADSIEGGLSVIPSGLQKFLGIDNTVDNIRKSSADAMKVFNNKLIETGSTSKAVGASIKSWGKGIKGSVGITGSFLLILGAVYSITRGIEGSYKALSNKIGISLVQAKNLYKVNLDLIASSKNQFMTMEGLNEIQAALVHSTGQVFDLATEGGQKLALELAGISTVFGYSKETAVELYETFSQLGADKKFATSLQRQLGFVSEMAGLSPKLISQDLIENADIVSTYFAGLPEMAGKTAIAVRRMGVSLKQAGDMAQRMLNLESFITDMFELAAMGGPDLSNAFEFGIRGDIEGMTEEVMNAIGSVKAFGEMDFLQRQKLANTLGMTTGELSKSLMLREKLVGMTEAEKLLVESNLDSFGDLQNMDQQAIRNRMAELQSTQRLTAAWGKIKAVLIKAILPLAESFADMLEGAAPLIDTIIGGFKLLGGVIKGAVWFVSGMLKPLKQIGIWVGSITELFKGTEKSAEKTNQTIAGIGVGMKAILTTAGTAFGIWALGGGFLLRKLASVIPAFRGASTAADAAGKGITKGLAKVVPGLGSIEEKTKKVAGKRGLWDRLFGKAPTVEFDKVSKRWRDTSGKFVKTPAPKQGILKRMLGKITGTGVDMTQPTIKAVRTKFPTPTITPAPVIGDRVTNNVSKLSNIAKAAPKIAASLLILSGALWVFSKAVKNFVGIRWEDIGKATASLVGLIGISKLMGKASPQMILGSIGIAAMGAALIPISIGLKFFSGVKWGDIAKAGVTLLGLSTVGILLGSAAPQMIVGAIGLAAMGAALIPMAFGLKMFSDIKWGDLAKAGVAIVGLSLAVGALGAIMMSGVGAAVILSGAAALAVMGAALLPLAMAVKKLSDSDPSKLGIHLKELGHGLSEMMSLKIPSGESDPINKLKELAAAIDPLQMASKVISMLGDSITELSETLHAADFTKIDELHKIKGFTSSVGVQMPIRGEQRQAVAQPPRPENTAQNVLIKERIAQDKKSESKPDPIQEAIAAQVQSGGASKKMETLMVQLITEIQKLNNRPIVLQFDDGTTRKLNYTFRGMNNNR